MRINSKDGSAITLRGMLVIPVFIGWISFLYPDLTFENDVCKAYTDTGKGRTQLSGADLYGELLEAEPEQIRVKSRLLEFLLSLHEEVNERG